MNVNVIYEDNHIIVVEKPAGILSQAGSLDLPDLLTQTKTFLKEKYQKPGNVFLGLVHRLDTNVSGIMVYGKTSKAASRISEQIRSRTFTKKYLAVVEGLIDSDIQYELVDYIKKDEVNKKAIITSENLGKESHLVFTAIANKIISGKHYTLVNIELETGRFHQIRAQLAKFGHPIYNDGKYGQQIQGNTLGLHAYQISFQHPTLKEIVTYQLLPKQEVFKYFSEDIKTIGDTI